MTGEDLYLAWVRVAYKRPSLRWRQLSPHTQTEWRPLAEKVEDLGKRLIDR